MCNNIAQNIIRSTIVTLFSTTGPVQVKLMVHSTCFALAGLLPLTFYTPHQVLQDAGLLKRIVEANAGNEEDIRKNAGRRGYMGAITQIASALVNCATNEEDVRLAMQSACTLILHLSLSLSLSCVWWLTLRKQKTTTNGTPTSWVPWLLLASCKSPSTSATNRLKRTQRAVRLHALFPALLAQYSHRNDGRVTVAAAIASRGLMKAARLADNATAVNGMSRKPIITSAAAAKPSAAPTARASSAIAEAIRKAREEKRATARAAGGRAKHGFRRGSKDRSSSFPEVELFIPASMASTSAADNITGPGGEAEQASNGHCQEDNVAVEGEANGTGSQDEKENARDHQCLNGQNSV